MSDAMIGLVGAVIGAAIGAVATFAGTYFGLRQEQLKTDCRHAVRDLKRFVGLYELARHFP